MTEHLVDSDTKKINPKHHKIIGVVIIAIVIIFLSCFFINRLQEHNIETTFEEVHSYYLVGDYSRALETASKLPNPYNHYYQKYIVGRYEIENWSGTGPQLLDWIEKTLHEINLEVGSSGKYDYLDPFHIVFNCSRTKSALDNKSTQIKKEYGWYPEFYELQKTIWTDYIEIFEQEQDLFTLTPVNGYVTIPYDAIIALDEQMEEWYSKSTAALNQFKVQYDTNDGELDNELEQIENGFEHFFENASLSRQLDGKKANLIYGVESALRNSELYEELCHIQLMRTRPTDDISGILDPIDHETWEQFKNYMRPTRAVVRCVLQVYPDAVPKITEPDYSFPWFAFLFD